MKYLVLAFLLLPIHVVAKESCSPQKLGLSRESVLAERLFYTGTCHYRNKNYSKAVNQWNRLLAIKKIDPQFVSLKVDVLNNLGYMLFFGHGTAEDKHRAMAYWKTAASLGHTESEYHLCHAYADKEVSTYQPKQALKQCKKAKSKYQKLKKRDAEENMILSQINHYLKDL
jgi:TPR repeat protein